MPAEARSYLAWCGRDIPEMIEPKIIQESDCDLRVCDADSDILFDAEKATLSKEEYEQLKVLALKSAADFEALYRAIPNKAYGAKTGRKTFYGLVPRSAEEMYAHTKNVNDYYFAEIGVEADHAGTIWDCRRRGFEKLEAQADDLSNPVFEGSYGELWSLRKVLRRFIWHDRIHAKAMYRMAVQAFGKERISNPFYF